MFQKHQKRKAPEKWKFEVEEHLQENSKASQLKQKQYQNWRWQYQAGLSSRR